MIKSFEDFINESKADNVQESLYDKTLIKAATCDEPNEAERHNYVRLIFEDKFYEEVVPSLYIKIEDFGDYSKEGFLSSVYNLGKSLSAKITQVEVGEWSGTKQDWVTFASSHLRKTSRMWHPEWIESEELRKYFTV